MRSKMAMKVCEQCDKLFEGGNRAKSCAPCDREKRRAYQFKYNRTHRIERAATIKIKRQEKRDHKPRADVAAILQKLDDQMAARRKGVDNVR